MAYGHKDWLPERDLGTIERIKRQTPVRAIGLCTTLNTAIYTVPVGKVLYISSAFLMGWSTSAAGAAAPYFRMYMASPTLSDGFLACAGHGIWPDAGKTELATCSTTLSFAAPLSFSAGQVIWVQCDAGVTSYYGYAGFQGWLEDA